MLQLEVVAFTVVRANGLGGVKLPPVLGATLNVTDPLGVLEPAPAMSFTNAVHVVGVPTAGLAGLQTTLVEVDRRFTVTAAVPKLVRWIAVVTKSPRTVAAPAAVPVTLIVQLPATRAQLAGPETPPV